MRIAFAGDRDVAVRVLACLRAEGVEPLALCVSDPGRATHADALMALAGTNPERVLVGAAFREPPGLELLGALDLDFLICVHFPYLVPRSVLDVARQGVLNLHPAFLPFNRGWHTPSWAILDGTPYGATLHFMDEGIDSGDIVHRKLLAVRPGDTAHTLYERVKAVELEVFREAWPALRSGTFTRLPQTSVGDGTSHGRAVLAASGVQRLDLGACTPVGTVLRQLRALTTSRVEEAAYFDEDGRRYRVQVTITDDQ